MDLSSFDLWDTSSLGLTIKSFHMFVVYGDIKSP